MQQSIIRQNQPISPSYRAKASQWPFRVAYQSESAGGGVMMTNAKRIIATTRLHFLKTDAASAAHTSPVSYQARP